MKFRSVAAAAAVLFAGAASAAPVVLGAFTFESTQFGNTLAQSDGGTFAASNWLNIANANPGAPAYLTGANFNTGIANIGFSGGPVTYTIGYSAPILNATGNDFGVVVARFSTDPFDIAVSTDGTTFSATQTVAAGGAVDSGVSKSYFYGGSGPFTGELFVHSLDLSSFGIASGASVKAIRITGTTQLDLIRAAAFLDRTTTVPEPSGLALVSLALGALALGRRRSPQA